ncbi:translocation/assembly module TamB domain-containing protein [Massilia sp. R2A-15]|uniref:translocation/assembly module TamB domain-containing protein n=1 Tax=Massilia sp. R2A-15 TaxID=3064278 RepID=UPI002733663F|nr:translocation/assembly module TamB domain-containing protein [Massilia sp. R2A-15]WLI89575.1 translocation/assembly module TamB domain-containing protein [Massilia sp. R2A-15]
MAAHDTPTGKALPPVRPRRWPRRLAIAAAITAALLAGAYWYGGREATLQTLAQRVATSSKGAIALTGVTGSLYGSMHIAHAVFKSPDQQISADNIDIDWSPWQYLSKGVAISKLRAASLTSKALRDTGPAKMPVSLTPPMELAIADGQIAKVELIPLGASAGTVLADVRFKLHGDRKGWQLRDASAITTLGMVKADGSIGASKPFGLDAKASLTQLKPQGSGKPAQLNLRASGDLTATELAAEGQSGAASGDAKFSLSPFAPVPLRAMTINGRGIDPGFFNPALPTADLSIAVAAKVAANRDVSGSVALDNQGPAGTIDHQRLPLRAMRGKLGGSLAQLDISDVLVDFGAAGKFTGSGAVARTSDDKGIGTAEFVLHTDRIDLKSLHSRMKSTKIAGDIKLSNAGNSQMLIAKLAESGLRLDARATLENNLLTIDEGRLAVGAGHIDLLGNASLTGDRAFKVSASAAHFNPAALGDYPAADLNADLRAGGHVAPAWKVAADFALRPSRLFNQPLSGKGKLDADAAHVSNVDAALALGQNAIDLRGSFGKPGERLLWSIDGKQLSAARSDLYGALKATGAITGTMAAPRTSFVVDADGLGWTPAARKSDNGALHASGDAWLDARVVEVKASGTAQRLNPAAFGSPLAGSINGAFDVSGRLGADWRGALNLHLQPSTLANAPLFGYAKLAADAQHVSNADVDLHVGPNVVNARGSFGAGGDHLDWRIDAPQLAVLGPDFGGALKGAGTVSGSMQAPALKLALDGQNLRLLGKHQLKSLRATASVGSGQGAADPLVSDIEIANYASGAMRIANAHLQTSGTRGAHALRLTARGDSFDALAEVRGGWNGGAWTGTVDKLQNTGRYALTLQAPTALRLAGAPGTGVMGLTKPEQISLANAVIKLPEGTVSIQSLDKNGARWTSKGVAAGVPLTYLSQFSQGMRDNLAGDLTLGAQWALDMQAVTGAAAALNGMLHVFREKGDLVAGSEVPVVLGLRTLDARADVAGGALRMQLDLDGARAGHARVDATARMIDGRLGNDSPLKLDASADMGSIAWLAPLTGQPALELDGTLKLNLTGAGTVGAPTLNGSVNGDSLALRWADQGVKLRNGQLRAKLAGDQLVLQRLAFDGATGHAAADGAVRFSGGEATMNLKLVADKLEILSRPDRTLVVTGQSTLVRDARHFTLDGKFKADRALVELAPQGRPVLSDDVVVLGRDKAGLVPKDAKPQMPLTVDLEADLGDSFRLRGLGADAELAGTVRLRASGGRAPRVNGTIRVVSGNYAAYGQKLAIERGVITFNGPYDNPSLNILAVRKRPEGEQLTETNVEAGVEVRGTALAPAAKLVSTPSVPDSEKLSWLVLGHGMEGTSGNEAGVLSAAAGALLGGKGGGFQSRLANSLGVDELGLSQAKGLESTVVTVGKRISARAYISFEQGATTASSLVKLRYKLNPRITLQLQTGTNTALDVLYSWAFD